jgi:riboflavin synthase
LIVIRTKLVTAEINPGESIAVNGACLTVTAREEGQFQAEISSETMGRTNLKNLAYGDLVNVERALRLADLVGGHLVTGHVDAIGKISHREEKGGSIVLACDLPAPLSRYLVEKGSIAIDGVSLTVNECRGSRFYVNIIGHTARMTTLGTKKAGSLVNLEMDIIGKYVEKMLPARLREEHLRLMTDNRQPSEKEW